MKRHLLQLSFTLLLVSTTSAYYQAEQGRWLSRDPVGEAGGENLYVIIHNDNINDIDLLGLYSAYSGNPHEGTLASTKKIDDARAKLAAVIQRLQTDMHDSTGVKCFDVQILDDPNGGQVSFSDIADAPQADYSFITAHGSERHYENNGSHTRVFYDYSNGGSLSTIYMNDSAFQSLANRFGNACTVYGCYSERDNPDDTADLATEVLLHLKEDLDALKCTDNACETITVTVVFSYMGG